MRRAPPSGPTVVALPPPGNSLAVSNRKTGNAVTTQLLRQEISTQDRWERKPRSAAPQLARYLGRRRVQPSVPRPEMLAQVRLLAVQRALWVAPPSMQTMRRPMKTIYRHATTSLIPNACIARRYGTDVPLGGYGYYGYAGEGYPWYDWGGPGFFGGGVFVFDRDRGFHHDFHDGHHNGFHSFHASGFRGGGGRRG